MAKEQIKHLIHTLHRIVGKCCCLHRWRPFAKDVLLWQSGWSTIKCVHSCVHFYYFYALCRSAIGPHSWKHNYEQFFEERLPKRRLSLHIPNHLDQTWGCHNTFFIAVLLSFVIWSSFWSATCTCQLFKLKRLAAACPGVKVLNNCLGKTERL